MKYSSTAVAAATLAMGARAMVFDIDNSPPNCRAMCEPVAQLRDVCEPQLATNNIEDQLAAQCYCTNESFQVAVVSAFCYDCIRQAIETANSNATVATSRLFGKRQAVDGSDCETDDQCRSGVCATRPDRPNKVCGEDDGADEEPIDNDDALGGGSANVGEECEENEDCRSGLCGDEDGSRVCLDPNGDDEEEPEAPAGAIDGSDCQTDDQCRSGFCATSPGRPNKVCQTPGDAPEEEVPEGPAPEIPPPENTPPEVTPPEVTPPPVATPPPAEDDGEDGAVDGSDCQTNEQCRSGFCATSPGRPNKVCQTPAEEDAPEDDAPEEDVPEEEAPEAPEDDAPEDDAPEDAPNVGNWEEALNHMSNIVGSCAFTTTSWYPEATSLLQGLSVSADPATATSQLTSTWTTPGPEPTGDDSSEDDGGSEEDNAGEGEEENAEEPEEAAASSLSVSYFAAAFVAGVMALI